MSIERDLIEGLEQFNRDLLGNAPLMTTEIRREVCSACHGEEQVLRCWLCGGGGYVITVGERTMRRASDILDNQG